MATISTHLTPLEADCCKGLERLITQAIILGESRLPTLAELSHLLGCSRVTVSRAVRVLSAKGILHPRKGAGIFVVRPGSAPADPWERIVRNSAPQVAARIEKDIVTGRLADSDLSPLKTSAFRYGVSAPTMGKALSILARQGIVTRLGRRYRCATSEHAARGRTIFALMRGKTEGPAPEPGSGSDYPALEAACAQAGLELRPMVTKLVHGSETFSADDRDTVKSMLESGKAIGTIVLLNSLWQEFVDETLGWLAYAGGPFVLLDRTGKLTEPAKACPGATTFVNRWGCAPGYEMGRYLLTRGHRHAVYLSQGHHGLGSQNRLRGLTDAFSACGEPWSIESAIMLEPRFEPQVRDFGKVTSKVMRDLLARYGNGIPAKALTDAIVEATGKAAQNVSFENRVGALFVQALAFTRATVWVCLNDSLAVRALSVLRSRGVQVPDNLSIASFDDTAAASTNRITSYNFAGPTLMRAMVDYLLRPAFHRRAAVGRTRVIEVNGFITPRDSVARVGPSDLSR